jgi:hypothetical protein
MYIYIKNVCKMVIYQAYLSTNDDDVCLEYYSGKEFHINYSCLHVLRKTHKLVQ